MCIVLFYLKVSAQITYGTTGLLHMPSAEMQKDKTVMIGGNFLNKENVPATWWGHNTYNYFLNVTILPCLEIAYVCTLVKGKEGNYWPESTWGKFTNQDRYFSVKLRAIKEGQFSKYMPAVVLGANDALTTSSLSSTGAASNGFFSRFYVVASKHEELKGLGEVGLHLAYLYNRKEKKELPYNGVAVGASFKPEFHKDLKLIVEYDNISVNGGFLYSIWKDRLNVLFEMQKFKYPTAGVVFKVHLK